ncbi:hypothetical protein [Halosolutus gelatinilyticus]|uniref:hypothetical protein n=1 Tax=Halosolutus gelatinilyticus TaxID=2931975 RepID=UPI001FF5687F|nr:hypothetical protein [Halosolutus gelatinilyticus]
MTGSTASSSGLGLFDTPFNTGATLLSAVAFLMVIVFLVSGYQGMALLFVGPELTLLTGLVGATMSLGVAAVSLVAAVYMESGFGE